MPALTLGGYWFGGEGVLLFMALLLPALFVIAGAFPALPITSTHARDGVTGAHIRKSVVSALDQLVSQQPNTGRSTACLVIDVDDFNSVHATYGAEAANDVLRAVALSIKDVLRDHDVLARLDGATFAVALAPMRRADLETMIQLSSRLQAAISHPISVDASSVCLTASIGFCLPSRATGASGEDYLMCAQSALDEAKANGPASIRAYSGAKPKTPENYGEVLAEVSDALENGQIRPWFQPQISTDTGKISGFEALARWEHPERGLISPASFLPAIRELGLFERLGEVMLYHSLTALRDWERAGFTIPNVGVNFSSSELANPKLCDKIRWELDRFDLASDRLTVEILEDVIAQSDNDVITRNIRGLSDMGCAIDLDDFGTGHASIANIRRFGVDRIKIDRSYVTHVDRDREQQNMVAAILTMADRLNLDTLAEGVETPGEYSLLAQLGCKHVQGYSIAHPMPYDATLGWIEKHMAALVEPPRIDRQAG
ncbi:putative bifunctional diguanylate cyclase/phosphodiesterase [Aliiroseovarius sp. PTFE2010]|uniref:putative bifunctional diguanylate cyclase/phosphodiesterase n=1 Tax=Aliiroseovarius sp. PTFE2010 TaxID=3417190 RepID=UPI003CECD1B1